MNTNCDTENKLANNTLYECTCSSMWRSSYLQCGQTCCSTPPDDTILDLFITIL